VQPHDALVRLDDSIFPDVQVDAQRLGEADAELPPGHPAYGFMTMNFAANFLGLDNAATPFGLMAMTSSAQ
jgi:spore maturation protein SpmA